MKKYPELTFGNSMRGVLGFSAAALLSACGGSDSSSVSAGSDKEQAKAQVVKTSVAQNMRPALHLSNSFIPVDSRTGKAQPNATTQTAPTPFVPSQIRAAYGMPALPAGTNYTAAQAAQLGSGQTVYIIDSSDDPNIATELSNFNSNYGLPQCQALSITSSTSLPLAPATVGSGCSFSVVYSAATGGTIASTAPSYGSLACGAYATGTQTCAGWGGWALEIVLDVEWVHATAPLARIVLIEAATDYPAIPATSTTPYVPAQASNTSLESAIALANSMGPGIVSMSFGGAEGSNSPQLTNSYFNTYNNTYVAATGDAGDAVNWPASSPNVVAVGGTTLTYTGGARTEIAWSGSGGGVSRYTPLPSYQTAQEVPQVWPAPGGRGVPDVAFNADANNSPQITYVTLPVCFNTGTCSTTAATTLANGTVSGFLGVGGTSMAAPQWAGLFAVANAEREANNLPAIGDPHPELYGSIYAASGTYSSDFLDITAGSDSVASGCLADDSIVADCSAHTGYDLVTGLGTPNGTSILGTISSAPAVPANYQNLVQALFMAYFSRPAAPSGLLYYEQALAAADPAGALVGGANTTTALQLAALNNAYSTNSQIASIINSIGNSAESVSLYGSLTGTITMSQAEAFVTAIFENVLDRAPNPAPGAGLQTWSTAIVNKTLTPADAALAIMSGGAVQTGTPDDAGVINNRLAVANYFTSQITALNATSAYPGTNANVLPDVRSMMQQVSATTNVLSFQSNVNSEIATISAL